MTRKPTRRIEFTVPEELGERYDEARGLIPMATWIKAELAERDSYRAALQEIQDGIENARGWPEHMGDVARHCRETLNGSSADAKRAVRPTPKAGKR